MVERKRMNLQSHFLNATERNHQADNMKLVNFPTSDVAIAQYDLLKDSLMKEGFINTILGTLDADRREQAQNHLDKFRQLKEDLTETINLAQ